MKNALSSNIVILLSSMALIGATPLHAKSETRERKNLRNARYGEVLVVTGGPLSYTGHVYNTIGLNDCPEAQWKALDPKKLKQELKAKSVLLNGPRYFLMDTNALVGPGRKTSFGGLEMRHLADVSLSLSTILRGRSKPYEENKVARTTKYTFYKRRPVYELVSPKGTVYVMQSYSRTVNPQLSADDLPNLGAHLNLPKDWTYRVRVPSEDLILQTSGVAYVIQDNLQNSYQRAN